MRESRAIGAGSVLGERSLSETWFKTYVGALIAVAMVLAASWSYYYGTVFELRFVLGAVILSCLILLGDMFSVPVGERHTVGSWSIGLITAIAVLGPTWAALAALPSALYVGRRDWLRTAYETGHILVSIYFAGIVFSLVSEPLLVSSPESLPPVLYATLVYGTLVSGIALLGANKVLNAILLKIKYDQSSQEIWRKNIEPYILPDIISLLTASLGVLALVVYGPVAALVVVGGSIGSQVLVYRSRDQVRENQELRERVRSLEESLTISNTAFGMMMIQELGRRDGYTDRHAAATAVYAVDLACEMKLDEVRVERLRMAGLLHNIGLFGWPEELLLTTGRLNSIAKSQLAGHPARGEEALAAVPELREMAGWVRWHHERIDGRGYPDKLRGAWIPLEAKILAISQAYAAMVLDQPRRPGMKPAEARAQLTGGINTEFDGTVVRAFLRILDTETEGYLMADDYRFVFPNLKPAGDAERSLPNPAAGTGDLGASEDLAR